ncbi:MAG: hypothetical protein EOP85_06480 [Verrucomicrobiaceae bacterium]|nr:MAG: hypothetical protein EOP85_06480 [Verrucomicrobiaceae bacterium]
MKRAAWCLLVVVLLAGVVVFFTRPPEEKVVAPPVVIEKEAPAKVLPTLLEPRVATAENPLQSWERLLASDGNPVEDRAALADLVTNYLQAAPSDRRPAMGTNEEIASALTDQDALGEAALPKNHPALVEGKIVDRWGNPWFFHQEAADVIEVRSAGADGKLFTSDDVTK